MIFTFTEARSAMPRAKRGEGPNKMGLVREAIAALGGDPKPKEIYDHIKTSGVDIPTAMISSYKSMIMKKGSKRKGPGRPPKAEKAMASSSSNNAASSSGSGSSGVFDDVIAVSNLIKKHGASKLSDLIKLLAR